jgi:hypothetical protein
LYKLINKIILWQDLLKNIYMHKKSIGKYRENMGTLSSGRALGEVRNGSLDLETGRGVKSAFFLCA